MNVLNDFDVTVDNSSVLSRAFEKLPNPLPPSYSQKYLPIQDLHGRTFDYVRIAVTEKCNLRCTYCMPEEGVDFARGEQVLSSDEIIRVIRVLADAGVKKVRFTGGEPLVRKDIVRLVDAAANTPGIRAVHITTNGILFHKYARQLREAGLSGVNISLDTMDADKFVKITRRTGVENVQESIQLALELGFPRVKVNTVVMRGFNHEELGEFVKLTEKNKLTVRFIEFMPFDADQIWSSGDYYLSAEAIIGYIKSNFPDFELATGTRTEHHIYQIKGWEGKVAVIPAFTRSLCGNCSRIRVTADGGVRNCLYSDQEMSIRSLLRDPNCLDVDLIEKFRAAFIDKAKDGFEAKMRRASSDASVIAFRGRSSMTKIGG